MKKLNTSVVICGAGPAGLTLAHLLGAEDVNVVLLEKLGNTVTEPRAIAIDGESLRTLQKAGLLEGFEDELLSGIVAEYVNGKGERLFQAGGVEPRPFGFSTVNSFDQPALDRYLAQTMEQRESVDLRFNHTLNKFEQDEAGVRVFCTDGSGDEIEIAADYLVGCDGGRSTIRSQLGIEMKGESNPLPWLVIDTKDPLIDGQPDCRFYCDPVRPGMTIRKRHGERRWEWMLMPGEDREALLEDEKIREIIAPYTDIDQVDIYRKRVYDFHAILANKFQEGRAFLAGDAAHMTPPFAGQGLNSGIRDVSNLSWKLAMVVKGNAEPGILASYGKERRDHAWELIQTALSLGQQIQPIDPERAAQRDVFFAEVNKDPDALQALEDEMFKSVSERFIEEGLIVSNGSGAIAGRLLIQPEIGVNGSPTLLDECIGTGFSIVGYDCDPAQELSQQELARWTEIGASVVSIVSKESGESKDGLLDANLELGNWLGNQGPVIMLVRPDRFCMACAQPGDAEAELRRAHKLFTASNT
ncbi:MAG: bifunctional 3-(3-hydroxy-phenyl)propionate/3-hydroxycinnamic acid hydroxylase [Halioglobus sp.]